MSNILDNNRPDFEVEINVDASVDCPLDDHRIIAGVIASARHCGFDRGQIGVRITDDPTIRSINAKHLGHDYATDVISFAYAAFQQHLEGELVTSIDTAVVRSAELGWPMAHELLLYIVHGTLHIAGMNDHEPAERLAMRVAEVAVMTKLGVADIEHFGADRVADSGAKT